MSGGEIAGGSQGGAGARGAVAVTRQVSAALADCELTHMARTPIDVALARAQHAAYERALMAAGYHVAQLPGDPALPDCVFVEDTAIVVDELAVLTRPGAVSRRAEVPAIAVALAPYRQLTFIEAPATIDGGDVLVAGRRVFVGRSTRTNGEAVAQLRDALAPFGYTVCELQVRDCLHLKSAVTALADDTLLINPDWIDRHALGGFDILTIDPGEAGAANVLRLADRVIVQSAYPRTAERIAARGLQVVAVDVSELAKAEGAVTCCSLLVNGILTDAATPPAGGWRSS